MNPINIKRQKKDGHVKVTLKVELSFWHSTFGTESWRPKVLGFWTSTFDAKSWRMKIECSWSLTFGV